jgi:hypothetical protein
MAAREVNVLIAAHRIVLAEPIPVKAKPVRTVAAIPGKGRRTVRPRRSHQHQQLHRESAKRLKVEVVIITAIREMSGATRKGNGADVMPIILAREAASGE